MRIASRIHIDIMDHEMDKGDCNDEEFKKHISSLIEELYDCSPLRPIKQIITILNAQLNNATWKDQHVDFLKNTMEYISEKPIVNEEDFQLIFDSLRSYDLNPYRGTLSGIEEDE